MNKFMVYAFAVAVLTAIASWSALIGDSTGSSSRGGSSWSSSTGSSGGSWGGGGGHK